MKLKFLMRPIMLTHPGRDTFRLEFSPVVNIQITQHKEKLFFSGATPRSGTLNVSEGWQFYRLKKL